MPAGPQTDSSAPPWTGVRILGAAALIGSLGGVCEVLLLTVLKYGFQKPLWLGHNAIWMSPLSAGITTAVIGGVPGLLLRLRYPARAAAWTIGLSVFAALWAFFILIPGIHEKVLLIPAAGFGVQAYRYARLRPSGAWRLIRTAGAVTLCLVAVLASVITLRAIRAERRHLAGLPATPAGRPNVLLLVMDTQRASSMSLYGYRRPTTPALDSVATQATVFDRATTVAAWTLPGHVGIFTGRYPHQVNATWRVPLDGEHATVAEVLAEQGYATAGFVGNTLYCQREFGLARGFGHYEDYRIRLDELLLNSSLGRRIGNSGLARRLLDFHDTIARADAADLNRRLLHWIDRRPERPFFAFVNYYDVHAAYLPPAPFDDLYGTKKDRPFNRFAHRLRVSELLQQERRSLPAAAKQAEQDAYDGAIQYLDSEIGRLLGELSRRGLLDSTLVIVTSDHGEQFGEHGLFSHGNSLYSQVVHVPLLLRLPGVVPAGRRLPSAVSLRDLPATILELVGLPRSTAFPGTSLSRSWRAPADTAGASPAFSALVDPDGLVHQSLVSGSHHYVRMVGRQGLEALYDLDRDPEELEDLASRPEFVAVMTTMRRRVSEILADRRGHGSAR